MLIRAAELRFSFCIAKTSGRSVSEMKFNLKCRKLLEILKIFDFLKITILDMYNFRDFLYCKNVCIILQVIGI